MAQRHDFSAEELLVPVQVQRKRKRTGKACASCRRRKTRCTGGIPCDACRIGEMTCSYDDPDRRMTAIEYIQSLEKKVEELEGLLSGDGSHATTQEDSTPPTSPDRPSRRHNAPSASQTSQPAQTEGDHFTATVVTSNRSSLANSDEDVIETMVGANERSPVDLTALEGHRPSFAGLSLLQRMRNLCRSVAAKQKQSDAELNNDDFISSFDTASWEPDSIIANEFYQLLPDREGFDHALDVVITQSCCNMQFIDRQMIEQIAEHVYTDSKQAASQHSRKSFALLYAILALARRFEGGSPGVHDAAHIRGLRYFRASRALLDAANCRDLYSLQALLCLILYTQVSSMISTCYSYICMAVAAALQIGLFTEAASADLPQSEQLHRRRIYSVLVMADTYVTTALGLPRTLRDVESNLIWPLPSTPESIMDPMAGTYAHAQLIQILAVAVEANHPVTRPISEKNGFYGVEYSKIKATEEQLESWFANLPQFSDMDSNDPVQITSQLLLRMSYAHVQMVLYRPFLHHALRNIRRDHPSSFKAYACGSACIKAAMQVVWLAETLESYHVFNEAHWFTTIIISYTAACLVLFVMSNENDPTLEETDAAVRRIKNLCFRHSTENASMQRCHSFLENVHPESTTPDRDTGTPFNVWNKQVSEAFSQLPDDAGLEAQGEDVLQALSLPRFPSF